MENQFRIPQSKKLSIVSASILICYSLLPFIQVSAREVPISIAGISIPLRIDFYNLVALIAAGLAAAGTDWMLRDHPKIETHTTLPHMLLPALTAGALGTPLGLLETGVEWWMILGFGSLLLFLIMIAEYISLDKDDARYPLALMVLSAVSYGVFFLLSIVLRAANSRLYLLLLVLPPFFAFLCLRILHFRLGGRWRFEWAAVITLVIAQFVIALYYWPLSPIRYALGLLGPAYALVGITASLEEEPDLHRVFVEPFLMLGLFWALGIFIN
ncbi:MAG: hypothetical protein PWQ55_2349 [Chloroflexota bacterium]|nr:hypothetical protein [Chloroflexota bacterium]